MAQLIADSGSTKATWCLLSDNGEKTIYKTEGYNPYFVSTDQVYQSLQFQLLRNLPFGVQIKKVYFYGAGCSTEGKNKIIAEALRKCFPESEIQVDHDLLAAARALLLNKPGFAAILGTGTNTCLYNGKNITHNIDSLGYFLGDEGSGSYLGKKLLRDYLRNYLPVELEEKFKQYSTLNKEEIFDRLYNQPLPNRFLASFALFFGENAQHAYCRQIVKEGFQEFFKHLVSRYPNYKAQSFNCVGSIAYTFSDLLKAVCEAYDMPFGIIIRSPIDRLVEYHEQFADA
jgi:N-acetylglucosamine kinase-like BadF-type ATPase